MMNDLHAILLTKEFSLTLTCVAYLISQFIYKKTKNFFLFHPVLFSIFLLIMYLKLTGVLFDEAITFDQYNKGGQFISFFLGPAVVALGVPLYLQIEEIKSKSKPILISLVLGCFVGILSGVVLCYLLGGAKEIVFSIAPKSVTTPIAMGISGALGGIPSLTAIIVIMVGIFGGIIGPPMLKAMKIKNPKAMGMAMGACAHAVGTAAIAEEGQEHAAYGGLALGLCGVITAILCPIILHIVWPILSTL